MVIDVYYQFGAQDLFAIYGPNYVHASLVRVECKCRIKHILEPKAVCMCLGCREVIYFPLLLEAMQ